MDKNHQDETESKLIATEDKLWLPPLSPKDQEKLTRLHNNRKKPLPEWTGFSDKKAWDWLQLLIQVIGAIAVPLSLYVGFYQFTIQQDNDQKRAMDQRAGDLKNADEQQQVATLKVYLDDMTTLLLDKKLILTGNTPSDADKAVSAETAAIARAKTVTTLRSLKEPQWKATVVQFLYESHLIGYSIGNSMHSQIISLDGSDLHAVDLHGADLHRANLDRTDLHGANLHGASLYGVNLHYADLDHADLGEAHLYRADLLYADLHGANLYGADLDHADLHGANLRNANLDHADLSGADLGEADLGAANLHGANLHGANLRNANLDHADLSGADLSGADLGEANVTKDQLATAASLQGAIMPDGSRHP